MQGRPNHGEVGCALALRRKLEAEVARGKADAAARRTHDDLDQEEVTLAGSLAAGLVALSGGLLAVWFAARELAFSFSWTSPGITRQVTVLQFRHWEFLFAISFTLGFYVLHRLSRIREGEEHSERTVIQQLVIEASRSIDQLSPIEGLRTVILLPFGRLRDRRLRPRSGP